MKLLLSLFHISIFILFFSTSTLSAYSTTCPGDAVTQLDGTLTSAYDEEYYTIGANETVYYHFTPQVSGTLQVNSWVGGTANSLFIKDGCGADLWSAEWNSNNKSSPDISVTAGQQIVVALERRYNSARDYWLGLTFTAAAVADSRLLCPGNTVVNLEGTTTDATDWEGDPIPGDTTYYYHFTPQVSGTIQVDSWLDGTYNSLFIKDGCGADLWSDTSDGTDKSSSKISIAAGQQIVVAIERRYNTQRDFRLDLTFEASDCPGSIIGNLENTAISATDSDSGTITGDTTYYYHFTPQVAGSIQVDSWVEGVYNSLYIKDGCGANLWSDTSDGTNKSSPQINVTAGQQIVIALERRWNIDRDYSIDFDFTVAAFAANDDMALVPHNTNKVIDILANDNRVDATTITITTSPSHGTLSILANGTVLYKPTSGYAGTDSFVYEVKDTTGNNTDSATVSITVSDAVNEDYRDFTLRTQLYLKGAMKTIGNTVLVPPTQTPSDNAGYDLSGNMCDTYTNGAFISNASETNDEYFLCEYKLDPNTDNSTAAELVMPPAANIAWVGLYWQAIVHEDDFTTNMSVKLGRTDFTYSDFNFTTVIPTVLDYMPDAGTDDFVSYAAFADVTDLFQNNGWKAGHYVVADVLISEGKNDGLGLYGAWTLVVIYEDSLNETEKFRSFSVFDGWKQIQADDWGGPSHLQIDVSGFYTPKKPITSSVSVFTAEGDKNIEGDTLSTVDYNNGNTVFLPTGSNNSFNSSISSDGTRAPSLINNNGIDIQTYNIGDYLTSKQSNMEFHFRTANSGNARDTYWPSMIAFETELVAPQLCYDYSYKQNGRYLSKENNNSRFPGIEGYVTSDPIEAAFYLRSTESDFPVQGVSLSSDFNTSTMRYIPDSTYISAPNSPLYSTFPYPETSGGCNYTDTGDTARVCRNSGNVRIGLGQGAFGYAQNSSGILDSEEFMYTKFDIDPFAYSGEVNISVDMKLNYYIVPPGGTIPIPYEYTLGLEVSRCPPSNSYTPKWGVFNVIDRGLNASRDGTHGYYNNLFTQVAQNPFNVDLVLYEADPISKVYNLKPNFNFNTTVLVDIINANAFGDINTSTCNDPSAAISQRIFVPSVTTPTVNKSPIPTLAPSFYASAAKNAAFRVWHFSDGNGSIVPNWTATTVGNDYLTLQSLNNLYDSSKHVKCSANDDCGNDPTSLDCFNCMFNNYAVATCSRDNFSIRPEAIKIDMYDNSIDYNNSIATPKNLSRQYGFEANATTMATSPIDAAAGYTYRFDFAATNHYNFQLTPNYTVYPNEINATLFWSPTDPSVNTNCNDTGNREFLRADNTRLSFTGGKNYNFYSSLPNVGEYRLNVDDREWTRVDFDPNYMTHHTAARDFASGIDCDIVDAYRSQRINGMVGCYISSEHTNNDVTNTQSGTVHVYQDHDIEAKPYRFNLNNFTPSIGGADASFDGASHFIYMSDINKRWNSDNSTDDYMAVKFIGTIDAVGADGLRLSNYVDGCYAQDLNISALSTYAMAPIDGANDVDADGTAYTDADVTNDLNLTRYIRVRDTNASTRSFSRVTDGNISLSQDDKLTQSIFFKNMRGQANIGYFINYNRKIQNPAGTLAFMSPNNPAVKTFHDLNITCNNTSGANCAISADLITKDYNGTLDLQDTNVTFIYGRTYTPRTSTRTDVANFDINYEIFCDACENNITLQNLLDSSMATTRSPYASGWRTNRSHRIATDGNITSAITEDAAIQHVIGAYDGAFANGRQPAKATYDKANGYPYKTRMTYTPATWLYYDKYNPLGLNTVFSLDFLGAPGQWVGQGVNKAGKSESNASATSSRRVLW